MTESKSEIGFQQAGLGSILRHNQLVVPSNQREYAWTDRQVNQLLQDFARAINDRDDYFLGTIVTIPRLNGTLEVVDGQQRLATTAILLAAIRDYLQDRHEDVLVEAINNEFLTGIDRGKRARVPKLKLNIDDNELFTHIVSSEPLPIPSKSSHHRLLVAAEEARKHVRSIVAIFDSKDHGDLLNRWVSFIEQGALAVLLRVPDDADAYKMFETLNDRGLRTSQADLIKNYLFGRSGERIDEAQNRWSYMRGALESLEDDDVTTVTFLRHALIILRGFLREAEVYDVVQTLVKSEQSAIAFATTLENLANAYVASFNPEHVRWNDYPESAHRAIKVFNLLNIKPMRPLLLAVTMKMSQREAASSFQFLLALGVRLLVASSTRSGSVELPLAEAANKVYEGEIETVAKLSTKLAAVTPTDRDFREACENARVSNAQLARYYLRSLETAAKGEAEPWFMPTDDRSIINLEHILPKKPGGNWPQFDEESVKSYANRLGNLALLRASNNSELKSDAFADKREVYAASPYQLTSHIAELAEWNPEAITNRQRHLSQLAVRTWPIRGGAG